MQGRIQDFAQGGEIYVHNTRSAVPFQGPPPELVSPPPPKHLREDKHKKWSEEWSELSEPLRKKNIFFYDLEEKIIEPHET